MNFPNLITPVYELKAKKIKNLPQHSNRASSLGWVCERELVYSRTNWSEAMPHDVDLQMIFDDGELHETEVLRVLQEAGIKVYEQQCSLDWPEFQITGHIDAMVYGGEGKCPMDVKSMSPHIWDSVAFRGKGVYEWEEVGPAFTKKPWLRKYYGQIVLYALLKNCEGGILLLKNKATGALAQVNVLLDYTYAEEMLQRAKRINGHVAAGTLPERIPFDDDVCPKCKFFHLCLPDHLNQDPLVFLEDGTVAQLLKEREEKEEPGKDFERIEKKLKAWAKARPESKIAVGDWLVTKGGTKDRVTVKFERL